MRARDRPQKAIPCIKTNKISIKKEKTKYA